MASGSPSRRRTISTTGARVDSSRTGPERTAEARSTKSCTDAYDIAASSPTSHGGSPSGGRTQSDSPSTPSGSRLVASTRSVGQDARRSSTSRAVASSRCSQLSTTSRYGPALSVATRSEKSSVPRRASRVRSRTMASRRSRAARNAGRTPLSSRTGASSTSEAPPPWAACHARPTSVASRVLPAPPGPTTVASRLPVSTPRTRSVSASRPRKLVSPARRPGRRPMGGWTPGTSSRSSATWRSRSAGEGSVPRVSARVVRSRS